MIQIREIDHLVLGVVDLPTMPRFHWDGPGCRIERRQDEIGRVHLRAGRSMLARVPIDGKSGRAGGAAPGREGRNLDHFCFRVEPFDDAAIHAHHPALGVASGPLQPRFGAEGGGPSIDLRDPEGNAVELEGPPTT